MRFFALILLLSACAQPALYDRSPGVLDTGTPIHRLRVGHYITSDGLDLPTPATQFYDTAFSASCFVGQDSAGKTRCFPNVGTQPVGGGYRTSVFMDAACTQEVLVGLRGSSDEVRGVSTVGGLRLNRIGGDTGKTGYFALIGELDPNCVTACGTPMCVNHPLLAEQAIFSVGEDITPTLETLELHWTEG